MAQGDLDLDLKLNYKPEISDHYLAESVTSFIVTAHNMNKQTPLCCMIEHHNSQMNNQLSRQGHQQRRNPSSFIVIDIRRRFKYIWKEDHFYHCYISTSPTKWLYSREFIYNYIWANKWMATIGGNAGGGNAITSQITICMQMNCYLFIENSYDSILISLRANVTGLLEGLEYHKGSLYLRAERQMKKFQL